VNLVLSLSFFFFSYKLGTHRDFVTTVPLCLRNVPILSASQKESHGIAVSGTSHQVVMVYACTMYQGFSLWQSNTSFYLCIHHILFVL
jgi:hypothetical protein